MKNRWIRFALLLVVPLLATGCWDRTELNDLAFSMGLAMDVSADGAYEATAQIAVPSHLAGSPQGVGGGGGGAQKSYFLVTGTGQDVRDAIQNMQEKLSRRIHSGHRLVIFIGENLARKGISTVIDTNARDPESRLRTDVFVVKGGEAKNILNLDYPFERVPVIGAVKLHRVIGGTADAAFRDFLMKAFDTASSPTLPVMEQYEDPIGKNNAFRFAGRAVFNKNMKLIGFIDVNQSAYRSWLTGQVNRLTMTIPIPSGKGKMSVQLVELGRTIRPVLQKDKVSIYVTLTGRGDVRENETNIDLSRTDNIKMMETGLNQYTSTEALNVIHQVQQQYGADVFGFGNAIHRKYPYQWRTMQKQWNREFPHLQVFVRSNLRIQRIGLTGTFLESNEVTQE